MRILLIAAVIGFALGAAQSPAAAQTKTDGKSGSKTIEKIATAKKSSSDSTRFDSKTLRTAVSNNQLVFPSSGEDGMIRGYISGVPVSDGWTCDLASGECSCALANCPDLVLQAQGTQAAVWADWVNEHAKLGNTGAAQASNPDVVPDGFRQTFPGDLFDLNAFDDDQTSALSFILPNTPVTSYQVGASGDSGIVPGYIAGTPQTEGWTCSAASAVCICVSTSACKDLVISR